MSTPGPAMAHSAASAQAQAQAAMLLLKQGRTAQAQARLQQAIALEPENPQWHLEVARLLRASAPAQALQHYADAERLGSVNAGLEAACLRDPQAIVQVSPHTLWTPDRLDIAAKLHFAQHYLGMPSPAGADAVAVYRRHILQRTAGREPEATGKASVADYELAFAMLIESMRDQGFQHHAAVPLAPDGRLLNGAHRVAAALALGLPAVPVVRLQAPWSAADWGMRWFLQQGFAPEQINPLLLSWLQWHPYTARFVVVAGANADETAAATAALAEHFQIVAWRALPTRAAAALRDTHATAPAALRYVLLEAEDRALHEFCVRHEGEADTGAHCEALPVPATGPAALLLDEAHLTLLDDGRASTAGTADGAWIRYAGAPTASTDRSGFVKWRNLEQLAGVRTIIDVGVADGTPDLYRTLQPEHVVFIEPVTLFAPQVEALRRQFRSSQYLQIGLSDRDEQTFINYREDAPVLTSLLHSSPLRDTGEERIVRLPVQLRRLDAIFAQLEGTDRPTLLKIDTEGYELQILRGAVESLRKIQYVMLELSVIERFQDSYSCQELVGFLQQQGFLLHTCLSASVDTQGYCRVVDAVFVNTALLPART